MQHKLASMERDSAGLLVDTLHSKGCAYVELVILYTTAGLRGMLECRDYQAVDMVFLFVAVSIVQALSIQLSCPMMRVHFMYSELLFGLNRRQREGVNMTIYPWYPSLRRNCF